MYPSNVDHASDWSEWHASGESRRCRSASAINRLSYAFSCNSRIIVHVCKTVNKLNEA